MARCSGAKAIGVGAVIAVMATVTAGQASPGGESGRPRLQSAHDARLVAFGGERAVMRPRRDATLAFAFPADIEAVLVQGGQEVKKGEALVKAWDGDVRAGVELLRAMAESTLEIEAAEAELALAKIELQSVQAAFEGAAATSIERERRENMVRRAEVARDLALRRQVERTQELAQREAQASRYTLSAPFDGVIDLLAVSEGQSVDRAQAVVRIVDVQMLHIDVAAPATLTLTLKLKAGDPAWVMFEGDEASAVRRGRVLQVSPVADASSGRRMVRVELENKDGWPAGMLCRVRFEEPASDRSEP
jgi:RND family efflux transporter MFP subunit